MNRLTTPQRTMLEALAAGGNVYDPMRVASSSRAAVARALERKGLLEQPAPGIGHVITAAGRAALEPEPAAPRRTVAEAFGPDVTDDLARWAIDVLAGHYLPLKGNAACGLIPWAELDRGRAVLEAAGVDWRALVTAARRRHAELHTERDAARRAELERQGRA